MRTMKGATWTKWENEASFEAAIPSLDTASKGTFKAHMPDGRVIESDFVAIVNNRTGKPVGSVKKGYVIEQMPDLAADGLDALDSIGAKLASAELWASDARQWLGLYTTMPVSFKGDASDHRLGFGIMNSFDASTPVEIGGITTRVVCENTLAMARASLDKYRHTVVGTTARKTAIAELAQRSLNEVVDFGNKLSVAREVVVEPDNALPILVETFGKRNGASILELVPRYVAGEGEVRRDPSATDGITRWSLFQAATDFFSHPDKAAAETFKARQDNTIAANALLTI
jgi:hypothetical protein